MKDKKKSCKSQSDNTENNNSNQKQGEIYKELYIINKTNFTENMEDLSDSPRKSNLIYLIVTAIFVGILWDGYNTVKNNSNSQPIDIQKAYKNLVAILLLFLGTSINFDVLNNNY